MIERIIIPLLLLIVLPDLYLDAHHLRHHHIRWRQRLLWWLPCLLMTIFTAALASIENFVPSDITWIDIYFSLFGLFVIPKAIFTFFSASGWAINKFFHRRRNGVGIRLGIVFAIISVLAFFYGLTIGPRRFAVRHIDLYYHDLPRSFDGYKIVHFSDAHVGSFADQRASLLKRDIDSINAQHADLIVFTGDLENVQPSELPAHAAQLSRLRAKDGVYSVLGNHDTGFYLGGNKSYKKAHERLTAYYERSFGWHLLHNSNTRIRRGADSLVIAGEGNFNKPNEANIHAATRGIHKGAFVVFLQHMPVAWQQHILPACRPQLTLCGHTHAGQVSILGIRPTHFIQPHDYGLYQDEGCYLYVTSGLGGVMPFRVGATPEIAVITLHRL